VHQYLKAIGFDHLKTKKELKEVLQDTKENFTSYEITDSAESEKFCEYRKEYSEDMGIILCGDCEEETFEMEYYFPYLKGSGITSYEDIIVEKKIDREMYLGICEDVRVGISLIFHLINGMEYRQVKNAGGVSKRSTSLTLSAMALSGNVLLPIKKNDYQIQSQQEEARNRMLLLSAAKSGDEKAMESLTLDDMDTYSKVSKKLMTNDVYTIVDTYFMPYGAECDQYSILGEILKIRECRNEKTGKEIYVFTMDVNELRFDVCVPKDKVFGVPEVGRRFKANIWLQGMINFQ
jgi:hypothetical protein